MMPGMLSWVSGAAILAAAATAALLAHWVSLRLVPRVPVPGRARGFLETFVTATTGPSRLAVVMLALWAALPTAHFPAAVSRGVGQALLVGLIVLVGWSAMRAIEVAAALHLRRFRLDVDDGLAARPLLTNLIAGVQIAITQPIRLEDAVIVEGEWGWVEEITSTYVVVRLWDWRRMVLPLSYFLEKPFQNWTRETSSLIGSVFLYVDYSVPVEAVRRGAGGDA